MLYTFSNKLHFQGIDGLKTGFTDEAGYCFTGTAKQGERRMISAVMGTSGGQAIYRNKKIIFIGVS
ncbi:hypothetical protein [Bacillus mycoides]|uniref:hypothetical protein n=2 Tax=Bacillus TaxID=1386 RepID=UPI0011431C83|nr:hypothetical protein [Bacillus mycoides]HDR7637176.1 hypothetical protein [Bacillus mycoides]